MPSLRELAGERIRRKAEQDAERQRLNDRRQEETRRDREYFGREVAPFEEALVTTGLVKDLKFLMDSLARDHHVPIIGEVLHIGLGREPEQAGLGYFVYLPMVGSGFHPPGTLRPARLDMTRSAIRGRNEPVIGYGMTVDWGDKSIDFLSERGPSGELEFVLNEYVLSWDRSRPNRPQRSTRTGDPEVIRRRMLDLVLPW